MLEYAYITDTVIEYPIYNIRERFPNISFPATIGENDLPENVYLVKDSLQDPLQFNEKYVLSGIKLIEGVPFKNYVKELLSEQELEQKLSESTQAIRSTRNILLSECDWTQLGDSSVDKVIWQEYRQSLRDITKQSTFPYSVIWPTKPS